MTWTALRITSAGRFAPFGPLGIPVKLMVHIQPETKMEELGVQDRLEYALATVAVIRGLKITDRTMRYNELKSRPRQRESKGGEMRVQVPPAAPIGRTCRAGITSASALF